MGWKAKLKHFSELMPTIILSGTLFFLAMHYNGHITLMDNQERQNKIDSLEKIISEKGCTNREEARKQLDLTKHEMVEVVRNASGYPYIITSQDFNTAPSADIFRCYMVQISGKHELQASKQTTLQAEPS